MNATTMFQPTSNEAARYQAILQKRIDDGARRAAAVMQEIHTSQPKDQIASTRAVGFAPAAGGLRVDVGSDAYVPSDYAVGQLATRAGVPTAYLRELSAADPKGAMWRNELAAEILTKSYRNVASERVLVRSVKGQLRGWLSDRFRRLDSRPLTEALASEAQAVGAVPVDGTATETRVALKVLLPEILSVGGDFMVRGLEWSNSDFGNGTHSVRAFNLRVVCLNGMTRENLLREIHLGGRLHDSIEFSDRTYRLDTQASVSALRDVVRGLLGPAGIQSFRVQIEASQNKAATAASLTAATKGVGKETQKAIVDAFKSEDVINLPAGQTAWRASNAISWVARHTEDAEKRLDLERLAGTVA